MIPLVSIKDGHFWMRLFLKGAKIKYVIDSQAITYFRSHMANMSSNQKGMRLNFAVVRKTIHQLLPSKKLHRTNEPLIQLDLMRFHFKYCKLLR